MDSRRYNMMMLQAQARAQEIKRNFELQFYARQFASLRRNQTVANALREVTAPPEPLPPIEPVPEITTPEPEFEE